MSSPDGPGWPQACPSSSGPRSSCRSRRSGLSLLVDGSDEVGRALTHLSGTAIASTAFTAIGASLLGYGIFNSLLARYPASAVVPFVLLVPIVGIATAWVVQDEVPSVLELWVVP